MFVERRNAPAFKTIAARAVASLTGNVFAPEVPRPAGPALSQVPPDPNFVGPWPDIPQQATT
jgi:hypothetical protein